MRGLDGRRGGNLNQDEEGDDREAAGVEDDLCARVRVRMCACESLCGRACVCECKHARTNVLCAVCVCVCVFMQKKLVFPQPMY